MTIHARHAGVRSFAETDGSTRLEDTRLDAGQAEVMGQRLATILTDLHDIGIAHGDLRVENVWLDPEGRPVLDGLGRARALDGPIARWRVHPEAKADDAALSALLAMHGVELPRPTRRRPLGGVAVALAAIDLVLAVMLATRAPSPRPFAPPIALPNGIVVFGGHHYAIGGPGDVVRIGHWRCAGLPTAALLRPSTGEIWTFPRWPAWPQSLVGERAAIVGGAVTLEARSSGACDRLVARKADGTITAIDVHR